jgi:hypothetical protein
MSEHLTPSEVVEHIIGRPEAIGAAIGIDQKAPYGWRRSSASRDAGDIPSSRHMRRLLAHAAARGLPLRAEHLIWGAPRAEIEALMREKRAAPDAAA